MSNTTDKPENEAPSTGVDGGRDEAFLSRWSRRKREARAQEVEAIRKDEETAAPPEAPEKVLTDADMPPIESLNESSDFSVFMSSGVSETLRRRALRKLFTLPGVGERCPLDGEYYDCHGFEPLGNVVTFDMKEQFAREAQKLKDAAAAALSDDKETPGDVATASATDSDSEPAAEPAASSAAAVETDGTTPRPHRRQKRPARKGKQA